VTYVIIVSFKGVLVSAAWRRRDNGAETCKGVT